MSAEMVRIFDIPGLSPYGDILEFQKKIQEDAVALKRAGKEVDCESVLLVEHTPVYTFGRHAHQSNMLVSEESLKAQGIDVYHIGRGGDVTFHGPGQLVVYPIIDLEQHKLGIKDYVALLEQSVIDTIAEFGITGVRDADATGVWIDDSAGMRKICAIGVKVNRSVTMHGLALNVNTDLSYFRRINPCGFTDRGVTSIAEETGETPEMSKVKRAFLNKFTSLLNL